jgi:hypothetical protein
MKTLSSPRRMKSIPCGRLILYKEVRGTSARGHLKLRALNPYRKRSVPPAARCPWSVWHKTPTAISSIPSLIRGRTAPRGFASRQWNSSKSWPPSYPCRASTWCAMGGVWHPTATCVGRLSPRHANRAWRNRRTGRRRLAGAGHGCSSACLRSIWRAAPGVSGGRYGSSLPSRTVRSSGRSSSI